MPIDAKIRSLIKKHGNIKIDEMMRHALSALPNSYYKSKNNIGKKGDFITSPEISQMFGETIAVWAIDCWHKMGKPPKFILLEMGPGEGKLLNDFMRASKVSDEFYNAIEIMLLEINPYFKKKQKDILSKYSKKVTWIKNIESLPELPLITIANEFFDALPVKQYKKIKDTWKEIAIITDPISQHIKYAYKPLKANLQSQLLLEYMNAKDGAYVEESMKSLKITRNLARHIKLHSGCALFIDYGYNIYPSKRASTQFISTLQAMKNHQYTSVLSTLGEADLTAHVDFYALSKAAKQKGIENFLYSTQKEFLEKFGINIRLNSLKKNVIEDEFLTLKKQVLRLTGEKQMGSLFKVLEFNNFD